MKRRTQSGLLALLVFAATGCAKPSLMWVVGKNGPVPNGEVGFIEVERDGKVQKGTVGMTLESEDIVRIKGDFEAVGVRTAQTISTVTSTTELRLHETYVEQRGGTVLHEAREDSVVQTPRLSIRQDDATYLVDLSANVDRVTSLRGEVTIRPSRSRCAELTLVSGQQIEVLEQGCKARRPLAPPELNDIIRPHNSAYDRAKFDDERIVPHAVGMAGVDAYAAVKGAGFTPRIEQVPDGSTDALCVRLDVKSGDGDEMGCVVGQSRAAGSRADLDAVVRLDERQREAIVPPLGGLTIDQARARLDQSWLKLDEDAIGTSAKPKGITIGRINSQVPAPGARVGEGSSVAVTLEPAWALVPQDLAGRSLLDVTKALNEVGFGVEIEDHYAVDGDGTVVLGLAPSGSGPLLAGTKITVTVKTPGIAVPEVTGKPFALAKAELEEAGLTIELTRLASGRAKDVVMSVSPSGVAPKRKPIVQVTVSTGPPE